MIHGHAQKLSSLPQILEAFAADDSVFVQNCGRLMAMSSAIITMSHYEFHNICDTKLGSISQRINCYQEVLAAHTLLPAFLPCSPE